VLNENAAIRAISTKVPSGQKPLRVGDKGHRTNKICKNYGCPHPKGNLSDECCIKFPEIKAKFRSKKQDSDGDKSVKATSSTPSKSHAWLVKSVACEVNSALKKWNGDKSVVQSTIVKKISTTHLNPKKVKNKSGTIVIHTFNMDSTCTSTIMNNSSGLVSVNMSFNMVQKIRIYKYPKHSTTRLWLPIAQWKAQP